MIADDDLDLVRSTARGVLGSDPVDLPTLGELGLLGMLVTEDHGGAGWCVVEACVVADEIGRSASIGAASAPDETGRGSSWLAASIGAAAVGAAGDPGGQLADALDGSAPVVAVAGDLVLTGDRATGALVGVDLPAGASAFVALGRHGDLHLVDRAAPGVSVSSDLTSIDTTRALSRIDLDGAPVRPIGSSVPVRDAAWVLSAAASLGSLRGAVERLVAYLSDRIAFDQPVASFQAIQHRVVDLALLETRAGVAVDAAARALAADPDGASRLAAAAHAFVAENVPPALDECIQLTGGIGFTWEYPLHHELRRSVADGTTFGSARRSREVLLEVTGWA